MITCLRCRHVNRVLVEGSQALFMTVCTVTGEERVERCDGFEPRDGPLPDPRGECYSPEWFAQAAARSFCRKVLAGTWRDYLAGVRRKQSKEAADRLEQDARLEWKARASWMTADELRKARDA